MTFKKMLVIGKIKIDVDPALPKRKSVYVCECVCVYMCVYFNISPPLR